ncbi:MAG TPA: hypothetical protein VFG69_15375, partial [Nannocystaceae bacterium]|nr:hypothetical protein [Nannocystaceae bacterium]
MMRWLGLWCLLIAGCSRANPSFEGGDTSGMRDDDGRPGSGDDATTDDDSASVSASVSASDDAVTDSVDGGPTTDDATASDPTLDDSGGSRHCCEAHDTVGCD